MRKMIGAAILGGLLVALALSAAHGGVARPRDGARARAAWQTQGPIRVCPESEKLWSELGRLQSRMHQERWRLFELLDSTPRDREKIAAQLRALRKTAGEIAKVRGDLAQYRQAPGWQGGRRGGALRPDGRGLAPQPRRRAGPRI